MKSIRKETRLWFIFTILPFLMQGQDPCLPILEEDFSDTLFPKTGWMANGVSRVTTTGAWISAPASASFGTYQASLTLPRVSFPVSLNFYLGRTSSTSLKSMIIEVSTTDSVSGFVALDTLDHSNTIVDDFTMVFIDLSEYSNHPEVWIRFRKSSSTTSPWRLDDLQVCQEAPPLPVSLIAFHGHSTGDGSIMLQWQTSMEVNNSHFLILRSDQGGGFSPLDYVPGSGDSHHFCSYQYIDPLPPHPEACYQLVQVDYNGEESCSPKICVLINDHPIKSFYIQKVTGAKEFVTVSLTTDKPNRLRFSIVDMKGGILYDKEEICTGSEEYQLSVKLSAGVYVLTVSDHHERITHKFSVDF